MKPGLLQHQHVSFAEFIAATDTRSPNAVAVLLIPAFAVVQRFVAATSTLELVLACLSGVLLAVAFKLIRTGLVSEAAFDANPLSDPPHPLKTIGILAATIAVVLVAIAKGGSSFLIVQYAIACPILCVLSFGPDRFWTEKAGGNTRSERLEKRLAYIWRTLEEADAAAFDLNDTEVHSSVRAYRSSFVRLVDAVREAPERTLAVRRLLGPLFDGTIDAIDRYRRLVKDEPNLHARGVVLGLLENCRKELDLMTEHYAAGKLQELQVEAKVLEGMLSRHRNSTL